MVVIDYNGVLIGRSLDGATLTTESEIGRSYGGSADVVSVSAPAFVVTWAQCADPGENIETDCELRAQIFSRDGQLPCPGDCNLNRHVTIDELVLATRIALVADGAEMRACLPADRNLDYRVDVSELVRAIATSLAGCE